MSSNERSTQDSPSISEKAPEKTSGDVHVYAVDVDTAKLAELGYKSEFKREFSLIETCAFSFSIMGIVASISSTLAFGLFNGGHVGFVWGWFIPSSFVGFVALSMAELASSMPTSAGLYYFSAKLAPERHAPLASWITGWANITGQVALVCSIDFTCAQMITTAIPVSSDGATVLSAGATYGILVAILIAHGIVCSAATKILARLNLFYVVVNVGTTVAAIVALLVASGDNKVSTREAFTSFENNSGWANNGWALMLAFTSAMWTLTGYDSAAHISGNPSLISLGSAKQISFSEETSNAGRAAPIAILVGVGATASLGWLLLIATSFVVVSIPDLIGTTLPLPMGQVFLDVLGKRGMLAIWSFIIVGKFVTGAAQGVDASRVVFAFARDNALPGSRYWKKMNRYAVPGYAVWFVMFWSAILGLLGFSVAALTSLAGASVIGLYTSYAAPIFLRITSGRDKLRPGPFSLGRWGVPIGVVAVSWVSFVVVFLVFPAGQTVDAASMNYAVVIIGSVFIFASLSWITSARHWFRGPVRTVEDKASD
ncbi:hypothetical protein HMN09_01359200 [Mycena chlorophos]|uniref:Amino acid transporter n=1 Tax=Mycena chlorophos TaxID=658473 RepID=A0A8H6RYV9_MYCCL|nr:hypothetical protein HMN09_01359200 [Mycena chlorophos]